MFPSPTFTSRTSRCSTACSGDAAHTPNIKTTNPYSNVTLTCGFVQRGRHALQRQRPLHGLDVRGRDRDVNHALAREERVHVQQHIELNVEECHAGPRCVLRQQGGLTVRARSQRAVKLIAPACVLLPSQVAVYHCSFVYDGCLRTCAFKILPSHCSSTTFHMTCPLLLCHT